MKNSAQDICLTQEVMLRYLNETLNDKETYQVESHLIDCAVCNQAIEQYACTHNTDNSAQQVLKAI